jgi:hypothetical protein
MLPRPKKQKEAAEAERTALSQPALAKSIFLEEILVNVLCFHLFGIVEVWWVYTQLDDPDELQ